MPLAMTKTINCDVALLQQEVEHIDLTGKTAVIIDILRATSTLSTAFANGASAVYPTATVEEARALKGQAPRLLCGERGGEKLPGFDLGNSPREYGPEVIAGRELVMTTTNGTSAIVASAEAETVLMASFLNLPAVVRACRELGRDVVVVCAGTLRRFTLEDAVCAGMICRELTGLTVEGAHAGDGELSDGAVTALSLFELWQGRILEMLQFSKHGQRLVGLGFGADLAVCSQVGTVDVLPVYQAGVIRSGIPA